MKIAKNGLDLKNFRRQYLKNADM